MVSDSVSTTTLTTTDERISVVDFPQFLLTDAEVEDFEAELAERIAIERRHNSDCGESIEQQLQRHRSIHDGRCPQCGEMLVIEHYLTKKGQPGLRCSFCKQSAKYQRRRR